MFVKRLISGIVLVALLLIFIIPGGLLTLLGTLAISLIGLMEFYRVLQLHKSILMVLSCIATVALYGILYFFPEEGSARWILMLSVVLLLAMLFVFVIRYPKYEAGKLLGAFFGFFYVPVLLSYIYQTRELFLIQQETGLSVGAGKYIVWLIFLCSWGSDTCAYCAGMLFGKHKMTPVLSPKKTWEGAVGGVLGAALLTALYAWIFREEMFLSGQGILILSLIAAAGAVISMIGDLAASAIKRNYDIKDYGRLIPGHGGILDRFDSVIITAPVVYYLAVLFL